MRLAYEDSRVSLAGGLDGVYGSARLTTAAHSAPCCIYLHPVVNAAAGGGATIRRQCSRSCTVICSPTGHAAALIGSGKL